METKNSTDFIDSANCLIDLHLHLDGAITLPIARKLAAIEKVDMPADDKEALKLLQIDETCNDLNDYLARFDYVGKLLHSREALKTAVRMVLEELKSEGVMYAEIRFAPQLHLKKGLTQSDAIEAVLEGVKEAPIPCGIILCCMRGDGLLDANKETIELAKKYLGKGVVAADLAGAEALFPTRDYGALFERAKELHIPYTIHAGEAAGPESVREALSFEPNRLGHGVRSVEDEALLDILKERRIPLELCPTSNIDTKIYKTIADYPLKKLMEKGIRVTINTDDKAISNTTLRREYKLLKENHGITKEDMKKLLLTSVDVAFAQEDLKEKLRARINEM